MSNQTQNNTIVTVNTSKKSSLIRDVPMNLGAEQALLGAIISTILHLKELKTF